MLLAGIPIKPFGVAKARLAPVLDAAARSQLGKAVAEHTARAVAAAGATAVVVTADDEVVSWARAVGFQTLVESPGAGLDGAAATLVRHAAGLGARWAVVHADLPLVTPTDLAALFSASGGGTAIAPSHDGGTNAMASTRADFPFSFGVSSFHRHLAADPTAAVVARPGLAHDLDTPADLALIAGRDPGAWFQRAAPPFAEQREVSSQ